jgi:hypothetical protein
MSNEIAKSNNSIQQFNFFDPSHFETMQRVCNVFCNSELVPDMYRVSEKNPKDKAIANCMIAIETANRIGASPLMVMQNMYIVHGKPGWSAKFLAATVNACGRFNSIKYRLKNLGPIKDVEYKESSWDQQQRKKVVTIKKFAGPIDNWECVAYTTEKGTDEVLESIPVTIEMAIREGWYTKEGSKWQTMTKLMLQYRSVTYWTSAYAPELSMGMKTREEIEDIEDVDYEMVADKVADTIKVKANKATMSMEDDNNTPPAGDDKKNASSNPI